MKNLHKALLAAAVGSFLSISAQAAIPMGEGQPYVGAKVGQFIVDADDLDDLTAFGAYAGYNFTPAVGVEVEYVGSSTESIDLGGADLDYDLKTYGIYGTYNYVFPNTSVYAKGKIGFAKAEVDTEINELNFSESGSDSGVAGGIAIGYNVNPNIAVEGEWAYIAEDVTALTIGAKYKF